MRALIFDVDGTITPSRGQIDKTFYHKLLMLNQDYPMYFVTGSDRPKTIEQVGDLVYEVDGVYNCNGNELWKGHKNIHRSYWNIPDEARHWLERQLKISKYNVRTGNHIEERIGMLNFSVVGRNADAEQRQGYYLYDAVSHERESIAKAFNKFFPELRAQVAGETGIDIGPKGADKSQIAKDFPPEWELHFFGDRMDKEGNDYPLKKVIIEQDLGFAHPVDNWRHTWDKLIQLGFV